MAVIGEELKTLLERNVQANLKLLERAGSVLREASRATSDPKRLRGLDPKAVVAQLVQLQLDFYSGLSEQSVQYWEAVVSLAEGALAAPASDPTPTTAASATELSGRSGETLAFRFTLDNPNDEPVNAAIESREWLGRDGSRVPADSLHFEPAATVIEPHSNHTVLGRLTIDERFAPGATYDTLIRVAGFPGRVIAITLAVAPAAA